MVESRGRAGLPWLVADVGGTNARFGWVADPAQGVQQVRQLPVAGHATPADAVRALSGACCPPAHSRAAPRSPWPPPCRAM